MKHSSKLPSSRGAAASSSPATSAHRLSHAIAKAPPPRKIRIIHVLAPEVIKTEACHFRELVQRLTGKPAPSGGGANSPAASTGDASSSSPPPPPPPPQAPAASDSCDTAGDEGSGAAAAAIEAMTKVKEEPETSSSGGSSSSSGGEGGGFLRALELDGCNDAFFKELDDFLFGCCDHMESSSGFDF